MKANFKREVKRNKNKHKIRRERGKTGPFCPGWYIHPGLKVGRGLGIFPARPKTPFVPGESTTRDKRSFCPGWWLHPGQKAHPIYFLGSSLLPSSPLPPSVPLLPPPLELPEHRRRRRRRPEPRRASPRHRAPPPLTSAALVFAAPGLHSARTPSSAASTARRRAAALLCGYLRPVFTIEILFLQSLESC